MRKFLEIILVFATFVVGWAFIMFGAIGLCLLFENAVQRYFGG